MEDKDYITIKNPFKGWSDIWTLIKNHFKYDAETPEIAGWVTLGVLLLGGIFVFEACVFNTYICLTVFGIAAGIGILYLIIWGLIELFFGY